MKRTRLVAAVAGVVALVLVTWVVWPRPSASTAYVTAPAARGGITQTLTLVGPVTRTDQASVSFGTNGLVTAVHVRLGDRVDAGEPIAAIDPAPLRLAVLRARADLAAAEAQLDANLAAQRVGTSAAPGGLGEPGPSGSGLDGLLDGLSPGGMPSGVLPSAAPSAGVPSSGTPGIAGSLPEFDLGVERPAYLAGMESALTDLQDAVARQQEQCTPVFTALSQLQELRENMPTALPSALPTDLPSTLPTDLPSTLPTGLPSTLPTDLPSMLPTSLPTATRTPSITGVTDDLLDELAGMADQVQACSDAMVGLAQAEAKAGQAIVTATQGLAAGTQQASAALARARAEVERAAREASERAMREAQAQLEARLASLGGSVSDATIAGNRAQLLQARQQLDTAEANLAAATLVSPLTGTVGALDLAAGEGSSGRSATIVGDGAAQVTVQVPLAHRGSVTPGLAARAGNLAAPADLRGQVSQVSVLPTGEGDPTFATEVLAEDPEGTLPSGGYAEVTLAVAQVSDVLTVPASAVTKLTDTTATVEAVANARDDAATTVTVVTGRFGEGRVEIVSGLSEGQLVVLADRRLPVPGGIGQYQPARSASPTPAR